MHLHPENGSLGPAEKMSIFSLQTSAQNPDKKSFDQGLTAETAKAAENKDRYFKSILSLRSLRALR
jgi:hypothetical protein